MYIIALEDMIKEDLFNIDTAILWIRHQTRIVDTLLCSRSPFEELVSELSVQGSWSKWVGLIVEW